MAKRWQPTEQDLEYIRIHSSHGATPSEMAEALGISTATLHRALRDGGHIRLLDAIKRGRQEASQQVANRLWEMAMNGNVVAAIFYLKARANWRDSDKDAIDFRKVKLAEDQAEALGKLASNGPQGLVIIPAKELQSGD